MAESEPLISAPRPERPPLKVNVFAAMQHGNTQLMPLFPYAYPGALVPAGALFNGGADADYGHFFHHNTQDEVVLCLAAKGCVLNTGQLYIGARVHGVNSFLKKESDPSGYSVQVITQRQAETGSQREACSMRCERCHQQIFIREFDATPPPEANELDVPFPSLTIPVQIFAEYNSSDALRTCQGCGHQNRPFPLSAWGWDRYVRQSETVRRGQADLQAAAPSPPPPGSR
jgi:hypothetical protein